MSNNGPKKRVCEGSDSGSNITLLNQCCYSTEVVIPNNWDDDSAPPSPKKIPELIISCSSVANAERYLEQQCNKTKVSKYLRKSVDNLYNMDLGKPQKGDLVLTTIEEIDHLTVGSDNFSSSFVIMGAVIGFKQMTGGWRKDWKNRISFDGFAANERLMVSWQMIGTTKELFAQIPTPEICNQDFSKYKRVHHVRINPVHHSRLKILQKSYKGSLDDINNVLIQEIETNFKHVEGRGWMMRYEPLSKEKIIVHILCVFISLEINYKFILKINVTF